MSGVYQPPMISETISELSAQHAYELVAKGRARTRLVLKATRLLFAAIHEYVDSRDRLTGNCI